MYGSNACYVTDVSIYWKLQNPPPPLPHPHLPGFQTKTLKTFSSEPFARQSELFAFKHHHIEI